MNHKNNRRIKITRQLLREALLTLMEESSLQKISITDLCKEADVNRSTFYSHYQGISDILREIEDDIIERFPIGVNIPQEQIRVRIEALFDFFNENKKVLPLLLKQDATFRSRLISSAVEKYRGSLLPFPGSDKEDDLMSLHLFFVAAGSLHLIEKWLDGELNMPVEQIVSCIYNFSMPL